MSTNSTTSPQNELNTRGKAANQSSVTAVILKRTFFYSFGSNVFRTVCSAHGFRPQFAAHDRTRASTSVIFVSQAALDDGLTKKLDIAKCLVGVGQTRGIGKMDVVLNGVLTYETAKTLSLAQLYFCFNFFNEPQKWN